jgi:hypothetical protein
LLRIAQAIAGGLFVAVRHGGPRLAVVAAAACALSACASGGFSLSKAEIDPTILTGATGNAATGPEAIDDASDRNTIRNAVSSADVEELTGAPLPWANAQTGARGAISALVEEKESGTLCRRFTTSRERFDGVSLYKGKVCMVAPGAWQVLALDAQ